MDKVFGFQKQTDRTMKFPYTTGAQIRQFPYKFYFQNQWIARYWSISVVLSIPFFYWIQTKARSPENIKKFKEMKAKELAEHHH